MNNDKKRSSASREDDLTVINGIGPTFAKRLKAAGLTTYKALANATVEDLKTITKVADWQADPSDWIEQALALQVNEEPPQFDATEFEALEDEAGGDAWRQHAGFSVFFDYVTDENGEQAWQTRVWKTRAYHDESGDEVQFPGIEPTTWVHWIIEQAALPIETEISMVASSRKESSPTEASEELTSAGVEVSVLPPQAETRLEITDVQVDEIGPSAEMPEKQLQAQVQFRISDELAKEIAAEGAPFRIEVHTVEMESRVSSLVASGRGRLEPEMFEYVSRQRFPFPEIGRYQLYCIALCLPPGKVAAYQEGPILNIVP